MKALKESQHRILLKNGRELPYHPPFLKKEAAQSLSNNLSSFWNPKMELEVEIGCGKGEFISRRAALHPERFFVGIDRRRDRHRLSENKLKRISLPQENKNWLVLCTDARTFIAHPLPPLSALHIYHPDPWPKARHHKHRFFRSPVAKTWAEALKKGGILRLSTDHKEYFDEILEILEGWDFLESIFSFQKTTGAAMTHFEKIFLSKGESVYKACYLRK